MWTLPRGDLLRCHRRPRGHEGDAALGYLKAGIPVDSKRELEVVAKIGLKVVHGCIEDARSFCRRFFDWYNQDHHHAGIGLMTPDQVHYGQIDAVHAARQFTLNRAFDKNPARFVNKTPTPPAKPTAAWINPPQPKLPAESHRQEPLSLVPRLRTSQDKRA